MTTSPLADETRSVDELRAALEPLGITVDFPIGLFEGRGEANEIYTDVWHLYQAGHRLYAEYLNLRLVEISAKFRAHRASNSGAPVAKEGTRP